MNGKALLNRTLTNARPVVVVIFGLQSIRLVLPGFTHYLREVRGLGSLALAPIGVLIFSVTLLSLWLVRWRDMDRSIRGVAVLLAVVRFAEILSRSPALDLGFAAAGTVLFGMYLPLALFKVRKDFPGAIDQFVLAILLGVSLDTSLHTGLISLDLSWHSGLSPTLIGGLLAICLLFSREGGIGSGAGPRSVEGWRRYWPTPRAKHCRPACYSVCCGAPCENAAACCSSYHRRMSCKSARSCPRGVTPSTALSRRDWAAPRSGCARPKACR